MKIIKDLTDNINFFAQNILENNGNSIFLQMFKDKNENNNFPEINISKGKKGNINISNEEIKKDENENNYSKELNFIKNENEKDVISQNSEIKNKNTNLINKNMIIDKKKILIYKIMKIKIQIKLILF